MLKGLSRERIGMEMMNLLALPDPARVVARMAELGVLGTILPEADPQGLARLIQAEAREDFEPDPIRRLAALLPPDPLAADRVAARLRLSIAQKKRLIQAANRDSTGSEPRTLAYCIGREAAIDRLLLTDRATAALHGWESPVFPLKGGAIVARGVAAGPEVARILRSVEAAWIAEGFPDEERVAALLDERLAE